MCVYTLHREIILKFMNVWNPVERKTTLYKCYGKSSFYNAFLYFKLYCILNVLPLFEPHTDMYEKDTHIIDISSKLKSAKWAKLTVDPKIKGAPEKEECVL